MMCTIKSAKSCKGLAPDFLSNFISINTADIKNAVFPHTFYTLTAFHLSKFKSFFMFLLTWPFQMPATMKLPMGKR